MNDEGWARAGGRNVSHPVKELHSGSILTPPPPPCPIPRMCNANEHIRLKDVSGTSLFNSSSNVHAPGRALASRSNRQTSSQHFFTRRECFTSFLFLFLFTTYMCDPVPLFFLFYFLFPFPLPPVVIHSSSLTWTRIPSKGPSSLRKVREDDVIITWRSNTLEYTIRPAIRLEIILEICRFNDVTQTLLERVGNWPVIPRNLFLYILTWMWIILCPV